MRLPAAARAGLDDFVDRLRTRLAKSRSVLRGDSDALGIVKRGLPAAAATFLPHKIDRRPDGPRPVATARRSAAGPDWIVTRFDHDTRATPSAPRS